MSNDTDEPESVWLFFGGSQVGGAFSAIERAEAWIAEHKLTGVLTRYPVDMGAWDYARASGTSIPDAGPETIANYASARQEHYHYRHGLRDFKYDERVEQEWRDGEVDWAARAIWNGLPAGHLVLWAVGVLEACCKVVPAIPDAVMEIRELAKRPSRWREFPKRAARARALLLSNELRAHHGEAALALIELAVVTAGILGRLGREERIDEKTGRQVVVIARKIAEGLPDDAIAAILKAVHRW
jgi:hypothetical protein